MRRALFSFIIAASLATAAPARAEDKNMIFREDSGLTKTEYLLAVGKYTAAVDAANNVLEHRPNSADAYTYRGYAYMQLGQKDDAAKNFRKAITLNPTHLGANKYLADIYLDAGNTAQALEQLQVIRMACGHNDCAELRALETEIDNSRKNVPSKAGKKDDKKDKE